MGNSKLKELIMFLIFLLLIFFSNIVIADTLLYSDSGVNYPEMHKKESIVPFELEIKSKDILIEEHKKEKLKDKSTPTPIPTLTATPLYNTKQLEELEKYKIPFIKKEKK